MKYGRQHDLSTKDVDESEQYFYFSCFLINFLLFYFFYFFPFLFVGLVEFLRFELREAS